MKNHWTTKCVLTHHFLSLFVHSFLLFSWIFVFITGELSKCVYSSFLKMNLFIDLTSYKKIFFYITGGHILKM